MTSFLKIKLMHIVNHLTLTGMEYGVIKLLNGLPTDRYQKYICVLSKVYPGIRDLVSSDIEIIELNKSPGFDLRLVGKIRRIISVNKITIVHSHNWATYPYAVISKFFARNCTLVHGEHGRETIEWHMSRFQKLFIKLSKYSTEYYTTVANHLADDISSLWEVDRRKIFVVSNGIDTTLFKPIFDKQTVRKNLEIDDASIVLATIAAFRPVKDHACIFKAVGKFSLLYPNSTLLVIGASFHQDLIDQMKALAKELCGKATVKFLGLRKDIADLMQIVDVYINASHYEGMSNTVLEAMVSKVPVIASNNKGNAEILNDLPYTQLFKIGDHDELYNKLCILFADNEIRRRIISEQFTKVTTKYLLKNYISNFDALYTGLRTHANNPSL
ncbi:MAG: glycosyltransferase [Gammaproteobacteria bacterium]|nr:glycosyltransferase [Gammaproteobacteria bacterium]